MPISNPDEKDADRLAFILRHYGADRALELNYISKATARLLKEPASRMHQLQLL